MHGVKKGECLIIQVVIHFRCKSIVIIMGGHSAELQFDWQFNVPQWQKKIGLSGSELSIGI